MPTNRTPLLSVGKCKGFLTCFTAPRQTCQPSCCQDTSAWETFCFSSTRRTWEIFQEAFRNASPEKEIRWESCRQPDPFPVCSTVN